MNHLRFTTSRQIYDLLYSKKANFVLLNKDLMEEHFQLNDTTFEQQFADCTMDPQLFSHEAHIRLAWIHITRYGVDLACENVCQQIQKFDRVFDEGIKYNATVATACVKAVNHFMQKSIANNFGDFIREYPHLKTNFKELLDCHYGFDIYNEQLAKEQYLEPDLVPFD